MTESAFGPLVSTWDVEQAVVAVYREWLNSYLAEIERQHDLGNKALPRPPADESYYGGLDFETEMQYELPAVIVVVQPEGGPERHEQLYVQAYNIQVGCVIRAPSEDEARQLASFYGAASMLLVQQESLPLPNATLADRTVMSDAPRVEFVDPESRQLMRSVAAFTAWISPIVEPDAGPVELPQDPEAPVAPSPEVTDVEVTVVADSI